MIAKTRIDAQDNAVMCLVGKESSTMSCYRQAKQLILISIVKN